MSRYQDVNSSWDVLDAEYEDSSMDEPAPEQSSRPKRRPTRLSSRSTPRRSTPKKKHYEADLRTNGDGDGDGDESKNENENEGSHSFVMPSPYSPPHTFNKPSKRSTLTYHRQATPTRNKPPRQTHAKSSKSAKSAKSAQFADSPPDTPATGKTLQHVASNFGLSALEFLLGVFWEVLHKLKPLFASFIAIFVAIIAAWFAVSWGVETARQSIITAIPTFALVPALPTPCSLPGFTYLPFCKTGEPATAPEFNALVSVQDSFSSILDLSETTALFPLEFDRTEAPLLHLRDTIKFSSQLPSKADIVWQFDDFIQLSRTTKAGLRSFSVNTGSAIDKIISMNRHTLNFLSALIEQHQHTTLLTRLTAFLFFPTHSPSRTISSSDILTQYLRHADTIGTQIDALILAGNTLLTDLSAMDAALDTLRETAARDLADLHASRDALYDSLWTYLGAHRADRRRIDANIAVAGRLQSTREEAVRVVRATLDELARIRDTLADVAARVQAPRYHGYMDAREIEEHVKYVADGLDRLYTRRHEGKVRAREGSERQLAYAQKVFGGEEMPNSRQLEVEGR